MFKVIHTLGNYWIFNGESCIAFCCRREHADLIVDALNPAKESAPTQTNTDSAFASQMPCSPCTASEEMGSE